MFESTSFFGWRQFLASDTSHGVLAAIIFVVAVSSIGVSAAALEDYHEIAVRIDDTSSLLPEVLIGSRAWVLPARHSPHSIRS